MTQKGLIHIYTGDGKGKTTAAIGQCIRAVGNHMQVYFVQFLKDGTSGEIEILQKLQGVSVSFVEHHYGFYKNMSETEKIAARTAYGCLLEDVIPTVTEKSNVLLVLDEVIGAYNCELISREYLLDFLRRKPPHIEVILTGREPVKELLDLADYVTEMRKIKHPFERGIQARKGIEY